MSVSSIRGRAEELRLRVASHPIASAVSALLGLLCIVALAVTLSPVFHVRKIELTGDEHLRRKEVLRLAGIGAGANALFLDEGAVERRLISDPWIRSATVTTSLPSEVDIKISERSPVGVLERSGGYVLVAGDGTLLGDASSSQGLPTVIPTAQGGGDLRAPASVLAPMGRSLRAMVIEVGLDADGMVLLRLSSGVRVVYGPPTETAAKAEALDALLAWSRDEHARLEFVDVRFPSSPTARVRGEGASFPGG